MAMHWMEVFSGSAIAAAAVAVTIAACSDGPGGTGEPQQFGDAVSGYGDWNGALPDTTPAPPVLLPNSVLSAANGDAWVCQNTGREVRKNFDGFLAPGATAGVLWPGALIQGATLISGTPAPIPLPRSPIAVSIDLAVDNPSRRIPAPTSATVQDAIASLQRAADSRLGPIDVVPARVDFQQTEASHTLQFLAQVGVYAKGSVPASFLGLEVPGTVSLGVEAQNTAQASFQKHTIAVKLIRPMYTISFADEEKQGPADFLDPSVTADQVQEAVQRGIIGPDNLPTYVKSVTYGRMVIYTMTNTFAAEATEMEAATQAAFDLFKLGNVSGGQNLTARQQAILSQSEVRVLAFGGSQDSALAAIRTGELDKFFTAVPATQAVALGYRVNYLKNARVATLGFGTSYTESRCTQVPGVRARYWHVRLQSLTSNGGCTDPNYLRSSEVVFHRVSTTATFETTYPLFEVDSGPMRDSLVGKEVVIAVASGPVAGFSDISVVVRSVLHPETTGGPVCGDGSATPGDCERGNTFPNDVQLSVDPYEFQHIITLPGSRSSCTATFDYQISLEPVLLRAP